MKVLLINGSPRKGNTMTALNALKKGLAQMPDAEVEEIICAEKTFVPWRYLSMRDIELPDSGNPYRPSKEDENEKKPVATHIADLDYDPWSRPSGYDNNEPAATATVASKQASVSAVNTAPPASGDMSWDDWLAPVAKEPAEQVVTESEMGTLDVMRNLRK